MRVLVGADHRGFYLREDILEYLKSEGFEVTDEGDTELDKNNDFPIFAQGTVHDLLQINDNEAKAILLCGSGQGMCMAANRFKGIRACLGYDLNSVRLSRNDDDANILCIPADQFKDTKKLHALIDTFLGTPFSQSPRFKRRIQELDQY